MARSISIAPSTRLTQAITAVKSSPAWAPLDSDLTTGVVVSGLSSVAISSADNVDDALAPFQDEWQPAMVRTHAGEDLKVVITWLPFFNEENVVAYSDADAANALAGTVKIAEDSFEDSYKEWCAAFLL
nr:hypothetical protein [Tanacetum cinerariifolium]